MEIHVTLWKKLGEQPDFELSTYLQKFMSLNSNMDRINFVYDELQKHDAFPIFQKDQKCDVLAIGARQNGNKLYASGLFSNAFNCYTGSILVAKSKEILALAYANRSAALLKLGLYDECLQDIGKALENGYSDKAKLTLRQRFCETQRRPPLPSYEKIPIFRNTEQNSLIRSAKNCVEIKTSDDFGRHVVATRNIEIGEIIAIEQPFAVKLVDQELVYCHECLQLSYCCIPCENCTQTLYCSITCKDKAFSDYHKYECALLMSIKRIPDTKKSILLPLKIVFKNGKKFFSGIDDNSTNVYRSDRLHEIRNLQTHLDTKDPMSVFEKCALFAGIVYLVKNHSTFLESGFSEDHLKENLLHMILICDINCAIINEFAPEEQTRVFEKEPIGLGLYSFYSLFNHSCCNNVAQHFHGSTIVLRTINSIKKGEQCFVNYGSNYLVDHKPLRQGYLSQQHFFTCTCRACQEDWPTFSFNNVHHPEELLSYLTCLQIFQSALVITKFADVTSVKNILLLIISKVKQNEKNLPPSRAHSLVKYALLQCYNVLGNKRRI